MTEKKLSDIFPGYWGLVLVKAIRERNWKQAKMAYEKLKSIGVKIDYTTAMDGLVCAADIPTDLHDDLNYRRGYYHGYLGAIESAERGKSIRQMISFFDRKLFKWRYAKDTSQPTPPPEL
jgi:hypothetical protein